MKKLTAGLIASLMLATSIPAQAEPYGDRRHRGPDRGEHRFDHHGGHDRHDRHEWHGRHDRHRPDHRGHGAGLGVLGAGLALGAILMAIDDEPKPPMVMSPIVVPPAAAPVGMWYYCASAGAYYPYVGICPEGWRAVPAR